MDDEVLLQFLSATGTDDVSAATRYLEMAGFELNAAVSLYFEMANVETTAGAREESRESANATPRGGERSTTATRGSRRKPNRKPNRNTVEEDAMPKALPAFQDTLLDTRDKASLRLNYGGATAAAAAVQSSSCTSGGANAELEDDQIEHSFAELFAPPVDMVCDAAFDKARQMAQERDALILVNVQSDSEFQSHALNRDVWSNDTIQEVVQPNFIFWQRSADSDQGSEFCRLYKVLKLPHISAVHPRTGRQLHVWPIEKFGAADDAVCELITFLEKRQDQQQKREGTVSTSAAAAATRIPLAARQESNPPSPKRQRAVPSDGEEPIEPQESDEAPAAAADADAPRQYSSINQMLGDLHRARRELRRDEPSA